MKTTDYILNWLKKNLSDKRYVHSLGCAQSAQKLAQIYELSAQKAYLAGLVHDCAKCMSDDKLYDIIVNQIKTGFLDSELKNPKTYHAIAGAYLVQKEFEIDDDEIISSVRNHTIGKVNMTTFEKIIFLADKIEPNTRDIEYSNNLWSLIEEFPGEKGLNCALYRCYCETIKSLVNRKLYICPVTIDVYNELSEKLN